MARGNGRSLGTRAAFESGAARGGANALAVRSAARSERPRRLRPGPRDGAGSRTPEPASKRAIEVIFALALTPPGPMFHESGILGPSCGDIFPRSATNQVQMAELGPKMARARRAMGGTGRSASPARALVACEPGQANRAKRGRSGGAVRISPLAGRRRGVGAHRARAAAGPCPGSLRGAPLGGCGSLCGGPCRNGRWCPPGGASRAASATLARAAVPRGRRGRERGALGGAARRARLAAASRIRCPRSSGRGGFSGARVSRRALVARFDRNEDGRKKRKAAFQTGGWWGKSAPSLRGGRRVRPPARWKRGSSEGGGVCRCSEAAGVAARGTRDRETKLSKELV